MDAQQLGTKVTQLETRVAVLEDEGKIVRGEVKQILTEIRTAILVRDNPFDAENSGGSQQTIVRAPNISLVSNIPVEPQRPDATPASPSPEPAAAPATPIPFPTPAPAPASAPALAPQADAPAWSLLTIAGISAWAEEAMRRLGPLRLEILLDLCEAAGHLTTEARTALSRITDLDLPAPEAAPSTNETVVLLRQLDALINDEDSLGAVHAVRRAA